MNFDVEFTFKILKMTLIKTWNFGMKKYWEPTVVVINMRMVGLSFEITILISTHQGNISYCCDGCN